MRPKTSSGKVCPKHPELQGERYVGNRLCVECAKEQNRARHAKRTMTVTQELTMLREQVSRLNAENARLRADYASLSTFNPEWDRVAAAQDSVREHMAVTAEVRAENETLRQEAKRYRWIEPVFAGLFGIASLDAHIDNAMAKKAPTDE